jgi:hypothetical protein
MAPPTCRPVCSFKRGKLEAEVIDPLSRRRWLAEEHFGILSRVETKFRVVYFTGLLPTTTTFFDTVSLTVPYKPPFGALKTTSHGASTSNKVFFIDLTGAVLLYLPLPSCKICEVLK